MSKDLTIEQASDILEAAFAPLRCVATKSDNDYRLRFNVFNDADRSVLVANDLLLPQVANSKRLEFLIIDARNTLTENGFALAPWSFAALVHEHRPAPFKAG